MKNVSFDVGDFKHPEFSALNPSHRVPVVVDEGFALYESAAIEEYLEDRQKGEPRHFSVELRERAAQRRMVREADQYFAAAFEQLVDAILFTPQERWSQERIATAYADIRKELEVWETMISGAYLAGPLSTVDFTLVPQITLVQRIGKRRPDPATTDLIGPRMSAWMGRMHALPVVQKTWPPHWRL